MSAIAPHVLLQIEQQTARIADERKAKQENDDRDLTEAVDAIVASIPGIIAAKSLDGGSYAEVMTLLEGRDYTIPGWKDRMFGKWPQAAWLKGKAAAVFAWCEAAGLQPTMAPYAHGARGESRIIIQWHVPHLKSSLGNSFLEQLCENTAEAQARRAAERYRERVKTVRTTIREMHDRIDSYSKEFGSTEVEVTRAYSGRSDPNLRGDSWTGDIISYCEGLGLTVRIETKPDYSQTWPHDTWVSIIYASWEKGMKVRQPA